MENNENQQNNNELMSDEYLQQQVGNGTKFVLNKAKEKKRKIKSAKTLGEKENKVVAKAKKGAAKAKAAGVSMQALGKTMRVAGMGAQVAGKTAKATGEGLKSAAEAMSSTGIGAVVGAPLAAIGAGLTVAGEAANKAGKAIKKTGKSIDLQGKRIVKSSNELKRDLRKNQEIPKVMTKHIRVPNIKSVDKNAIIKEALKNIFTQNVKKYLLFAGIGLAAILFIIFVIVLDVKSKEDRGAYNGEDNSNVPYVISSSIMDKITIATTEDGSYKYCFKDDDGNLISLDEALDNALNTLKENNSESLSYMGENDDERKDLLKKMIQAEIATQYPDLSNSESNVGVSASGNTQTVSQSSNTTNNANKSTNVSDILANMTLEEKIYQMIMMQTDVANGSDYANTSVGGIIAGNNSNFDSGLSNIGSNYKIATFVATDDEGGDVERAAKGYKNAREYGNSENYNELYEAEVKKCNELLSKGINLNLGPDADVISNSNGALYSRSYGSDASKVEKCIEQVLKARSSTVVNGKYVSSTLKHYPGYPDNEGNTDNGVTVDNKSVEEINKNIEVFKYGINNGASAVMVSNIIYNNLDANNPASLSSTVISGLRSSFSGVIMTDDIGQANAVSNIQDRYKKAIIAGNDMILIWNGQEETAYAQIKAAVDSGEITEERINESVTRILNWKASSGILGGGTSNNNSTGNGTYSIGTGNEKLSSNINDDATIKGSIKVQRKDSNGNITDLKYTSTSNFDALVAQNNENAFNYYTLKKNTSASVASGISGNYQLNGSDNQEIIWNFMMQNGFTEAGAAGMMGNLQSESNFYSIVVQDHFCWASEEEMEYCENYVKQVDDGTISENDFINNGPGGGGFGLAQWTATDRKQRLYNYAKSTGRSIGDFQMQLEFLLQELQSNYPTIWQVVSTTSSLKEASDIVLYDYENPAQKYEKSVARAEQGQAIFNTYSGKTISASSITATTNTGSSEDDDVEDDGNGEKKSKNKNIPTYSIVVANKRQVDTVVTTTYNYDHTNYTDIGHGSYNDNSRRWSNAPENSTISTSVSSLSTTTSNYQEALKNYTLYFDFLWAVLVESENKNLISSWADLAINNADKEDKVVITVFSDYSENSSTSNPIQGTVSMFSGAESGIALCDVYNKEESTTIVNKVWTSKLTVTYADTWIVRYENDADNYAEFQSKSKEKETQKISLDDNEDNIIKILNDRKTQTESLKKGKYIVDKMIKDNEQVSFMSDIYEYILNIALEFESKDDEKSNIEKLAETLDNAAFNLATFTPVTNGNATEYGNGTGEGGVGGQELNAEGATIDQNGYNTVFKVGNRTYKNYKQSYGYYIGSLIPKYNQSMKKSGCALASIAVIASGYGIDMDPQGVIDYYNSHGFTDVHDAALSAIIGKKCEWDYSNVKQNIINQLKSGKPCMVNRPGHFFTVLAIDDTGTKVYVSDVGGINAPYLNGWLDISYLDQFDMYVKIND